MWYRVPEATQWNVHLGVLLGAFAVAVGLKAVSTRQAPAQDDVQFLKTVRFRKPTPCCRRLLHWGVCIPLRAAFAALAFVLPRVGLVALVRGFAMLPLEQSFTWVSLTLDNTAPVGQFGGPAWWSGQRAVHALTYLTFSVLSVVRPLDAYVALVADVALTVLFTLRHDARHVRFV